MVKALVFLYLASDTRLAFLQKMVEFSVLPRVGEWVKLKNAEMGDYFPFQVDEITHREGFGPEIKLGFLMKNETEPELFEEHELDEYIRSYETEGWVLKSCKTLSSGWWLNHPALPTH